MLFDNDDLRKGVLALLDQMGVTAVVLNDYPTMAQLSYKDEAVVGEDRFKINQWFYCSWLVKASEAQVGNLSANYMTPAVHSIVRGLERCIRGRVASLLSTSATFRSGLFTHEDYPAGHSREITLASNGDLSLQIDQLVKIDRVIYSVIETYQDGDDYKVILDQELQADIPKYTGVFAGPCDPQVTCGGVKMAVYFRPVTEELRDGYDIQVNMDLLAGILVDPSRCQLLVPASV